LERDALVVNAIRHYMDAVYPWVSETLPNIVTSACGFSEEEYDKYYGLWPKGTSKHVNAFSYSRRVICYKFLLMIAIK